MASFRISSDLLTSPVVFFEALAGLAAGDFGVAASVGCVVELVVMAKRFPLGIRWAVIRDESSSGTGETKEPRHA